MHIFFSIWEHYFWIFYEKKCKICTNPILQLSFHWLLSKIENIQLLQGISSPGCFSFIYFFLRMAKSTIKTIQQRWRVTDFFSCSKILFSILILSIFQASESLSDVRYHFFLFSFSHWNKPSDGLNFYVTKIKPQTFSTLIQLLSYLFRLLL